MGGAIRILAELTLKGVVLSSFSFCVLFFCCSSQSCLPCRMTVVEGWFGGVKYDRVPTAAELNQDHLELIKINAAINSQVFQCCTEHVSCNTSVPPADISRSCSPCMLRSLKSSMVLLILAMKHSSRCSP